MPNLFQTFLNQVSSGYKEADKRLGGWLPGGGTAAPVTRVVQQVQKPFKPASIRDAVLIPALDRGLSSGAVPPTEGMYVRFLSGTSKPLTELPPALQKEIPRAYEGAIEPREKTNPEWFNLFLNNYAQKSKQFDPVIARQLSMAAANESGIPRFLTAGSVLDKKGNIAISQQDYASETNPEKNVLSQTLGRFHVNPKTKTVIDRYDFNYYMPGSKDLAAYTDPMQGITMLRENNPRGAIPLAHALGFIQPGSGYEIKAPF
jgi:hypothetical protein